MARIATVKELHDALETLMRDGFEDASVYLARDEEWNGVTPLYATSWAPADMLLPSDCEAFGIPEGSVAVGCFM